MEAEQQHASRMCPSATKKSLRQRAKLLHNLAAHFLHTALLRSRPLCALLLEQSWYLLFAARHFAQGSHLGLMCFLHFCHSPRCGLRGRCGALLREHQLAHACTQPRRQCPVCRSVIAYFTAT